MAEIKYDTYNDYQDIICPHCETKQNIESESLDGLVTYWGEEGPVEWECGACDKKFFIKEQVCRNFEVAKTEEDLDF